MTGKIVKHTNTLPKKLGRGKSPGTQENLKKYLWKKGQCGRPAGVVPYQNIKGRGSLIAHQLKHFMALQCPEDIKRKLKRKFPDINFDNLTSGEAIWLGTVAEAQMSGGTAREFIAERTEGRVPQVVKYQEDEEPPKYTDEELAAMADALDKVRGGGGSNT